MNNKEMVTAWLIESGIQSKTGGVYAWYSLDTSEYSFLYPEITAYFLHALCQLSRIAQDEKILRAIPASANWLISNFSNENTMFTKKFDDKIVSDIYFFDLGIILNALDDYYENGFDKNSILTIKTISNLMNSSLKNGLNAIINKGSCLNFTDSWSNYPGGHLLKPLAILQRINLKIGNDNRLCKAAIMQLIETINEKWFNFSDTGQYTHAHAHLYGIEGLIMLNESTYLELGKKLFNEYIIEISPKNDQYVRNIWNGKINRTIRTDVLSQTLRLLKIYPNVVTDSFYLDIEKKLSNYFIIQPNNKRIHGSILFGENSRGENVNHSNACATIFYLNSLLMHDLDIDSNLKLIF